MQLSPSCSTGLADLPSVPSHHDSPRPYYGSLNPPAPPLAPPATPVLQLVYVKNLLHVRNLRHFATFNKSFSISTNFFHTTWFLNCILLLPITLDLLNLGSSCQSFLLSFTKTDSHSIFCSIFLEALSYISRMLITLFWASITIIARYIYKIPQYNVSQCSTLNYSTVQYLQYRVYVCVCISTPNQVYIQNQATEQEKCFVGLKKRLQMVLHSSKIGQNRTIYLSKIG